MSVDDKDERRDALHKIKDVLREFLQGHIGVADFVPRYRALFAPFDPPDLSTDDLSEAEQSELKVFIRLMGGWFGEENDIIPKRAEWKYGEDTEPFSWIDGPAYRTVIQEALARAGVRLPD